MRILLLLSVAVLSACKDPAPPPSSSPSAASPARDRTGLAPPAPLTSDQDLRAGTADRDAGLATTADHAAETAVETAVDTVRQQAVAGSTRAATAAPQVLDEVRSGDVRAIAAAPTKLAKMGAAAVPQLSQALRDGDANVRIVAAWALYEMRETGAAAAPALRAALQDPDPKVRVLADRALKSVTNDQTEVLEARRRHEEAKARSRADSGR